MATMDQHCSWTIFIHIKFEPSLDSNLAILLKGQIVKRRQQSYHEDAKICEEIFIDPQFRSFFNDSQKSTIWLEHLHLDFLSANLGMISDELGEKIPPKYCKNEETTTDQVQTRHDRRCLPTPLKKIKLELIGQFGKKSVKKEGNCFKYLKDEFNEGIFVGPQFTILLQCIDSNQQPRLDFRNICKLFLGNQKMPNMAQS